MLAIIPARGGSKGLPGKNMRLLLGKPLIAWTIEAALKAPSVSRVMCTSDDPAITQVCREMGCEVPFVRPAHLAVDETPMRDVVRHAIKEAAPGEEFFVLLQPTSPLRVVQDIDGTVALLHSSGAGACISVVETKAHPEWMFDLNAQSRLVGMLPHDGGQRATRRQDVRPMYVPNGAVYVHRTAQLWREDFTFLGGDVAGYVMPKERSVDVDDVFDFLTAEAFLKRALGL